MKLVAVRKILMGISVQGDGHPPSRESLAQQRDHFGIALERKPNARSPVFLGNTFPFVADRERHGGQTDRYAVPDVVIHAFERFRPGEVAGVIIANRNFHAGTCRRPSLPDAITRS